MHCRSVCGRSFNVLPLGRRADAMDELTCAKETLLDNGGVCTLLFGALGVRSIHIRHG